MKGANLAAVLAGTLNPSLTNSSYQQLSQLRQNHGFVVELLIISDDPNFDISIRQSALIYLKNLIQDHCDYKPFVAQEDIDVLKSSILQALIRNIQNQKLTPTLREIIYKLAQKYYPKEWPQLVDDAIERIDRSGDLNELLGLIQGLKAVYSAFGGALSREIQLNNLCNKSWLALMKLTSKLFTNFGPETSLLLVSLFKLFTVAIKFYVPSVIELNIHNLMIFVKKILDLRGDFGEQSGNIFLLKKLCLRLLYRFYEKHTNLKACISDNLTFAKNFHQKYTKAFVETLLLQLLENGNSNQINKQQRFSTINMSLSILSFITRQNREAALLILQNRQQIIRLCLQRFKIDINISFQNFNDFKLWIDDQRHHFKQLFFSIINCQATPEEQTITVANTLGLLLEYVEKGDDAYKQLSLYLFSAISNDTQYLKESVEPQMIALITQFVIPLLRQGNHPFVRARACELISSYNDLDFPSECLSQLASSIYACMLSPGTTFRQITMKVYACNAFNSIMRFQPIVNFIKPYLKDILNIYTSLLDTDTTIIQNFKDVLALLQEQIAPFASDLVKLLINMFNQYSRGDRPNQGPIGSNDQQDEDEEDEEDQKNTDIIARSCVHSIRQILTASSNNYSLSSHIQDDLLAMVVFIFSDKKQLYFEEGLNILNLILYKLKNHTEDKHFIFFRVIAYALLGVPNQVADFLRTRNDPTNMALWAMIQNVSIEPDQDFLQNSVGCLRNFIAKSSSTYLRSARDQTGITYLEYLLKIVSQVHQNPKSSQTDRLIVLTIYISLVEHKILSLPELNDLVNELIKWMQMEEQTQRSLAQKTKYGFVAKFPYTSVYLQIIFVSSHIYGKIIEDPQFYTMVINRTLDLLENFKCDYQLERVIFGLGSILNGKMLVDQPTIERLMNTLPHIVRSLCTLRAEGDDPKNDREMDDEAEEERAFGEDQNTHMIGWNRQGATNKDLQLGGQDEESDDDWEQEFNKFYVSPLDGIDELKYLTDVLGKSQEYVGFMDGVRQQELSSYITNAPPKFPTD